LTMSKREKKKRVRFAEEEEEEAPPQQRDFTEGRRRRAPTEEEEEEDNEGSFVVSHQLDDVDLDDDEEEQSMLKGPVLGEEKETDEGLEAFNLNAERKNDGYFDAAGNFVWRSNAREPDAWLASVDEAEVEKGIGEASRRRRKKRREPTKARDLGALATLMRPRETLADALRRLGRLLPKSEADFAEVTTIADALVKSGRVDCYDEIRENLAPEDPRRWEYRGQADGQVHGPFSTLQIIDWRRQGFFTGTSAVPMRLKAQTTQQPPSRRRLETRNKNNNLLRDDDLRRDLDDLDDDDEGNSSPFLKRQRTTTEEAPWTNSDDIDFRLPSAPIHLPSDSDDDDDDAVADDDDDDDDDDPDTLLRRTRLPGGLQRQESDDEDDDD